MNKDKISTKIEQANDILIEFVMIVFVVALLISPYFFISSMINHVPSLLKDFLLRLWWCGCLDMWLLKSKIGVSMFDNDYWDWISDSNWLMYEVIKGTFITIDSPSQETN